MTSLFHFLHLTAVIIWIGGMFFAHFCLRPVAASQLPPPQRLPLLAAVLGRFFGVVSICIATLLFSGLAIMLPIGMGNAPWHWHLMLTLGLIMISLFALITLRHYPRLKQANAAADWPNAASAMNNIRLLVATNLGLGLLTVAIAVFGGGR